MTHQAGHLSKWLSCLGLAIFPQFVSNIDLLGHVQKVSLSEVMLDPVASWWPLRLEPDRVTKKPFAKGGFRPSMVTWS